MNVLFLSAWFPYPPDNGSRIRVYNLIKTLARRHKVSLISLLQEDSHREDAARLADVCEVVSLHESRWFRSGTFRSILGFFSSRPRCQVDTFDPTVREAVQGAIDRINPDVLIASTLGVVEYIPRSAGIPTVLDEHNCEYAVLKRNAELYSSQARRFRYGLGWRKFARWEVRVCRGFHAVVMVSEEDRRGLLSVSPDLRNVTVVPNGVDTDHYDHLARSPEPGALIYNGALTYGANLDAVRHFASDIYPILKLKCPEAKLQVTGRTTGVDLRGIADCSGVELTGYVSDIRDVLKKSAVCVVPLRQGGGSRLKILEAMAAGVPVVSTSTGAEGIDCIAGQHLLIADTPADFSEAVHRVVTDAGLARDLADRARTFVRERYDWSVIGAQFSNVVESVTGTHTR